MLLTLDVACVGAFSAAPPPGLPPPAPVVDIAAAYQKLLLAASGVLYEDTYLQARAPLLAQDPLCGSMLPSCLAGACKGSVLTLSRSAEFGYSELPSKRFILVRPLRMQRMQA